MPLLLKLRKLNAELTIDTTSGVLATLKVRPILLKRIAAAQRMDEEIRKLCEDAKSGRMKELNYSEEGILKFGNRLYVPSIKE